MGSMFYNKLGKYGLWYTPSEADKENWIKREVLTNRKTYYSMILVYVDDILVVSKDTSTAIDYLANIYVLKEESIGTPYCYLGANN